MSPEMRVVAQDSESIASAMKLALMLALVAASVGPIHAQENPCTREAVVASFAVVVEARGDIAAWAESYANSDCPPPIKAGVRGLVAMYELMGTVETAQPASTPAVEPPTATPIPTLALSDTPVPATAPTLPPATVVSAGASASGGAEPISYPLLIARGAGASLFVINLSPEPLPLAPLRLGDDANALAGAEWGVDALALRECVVAWGGEGDLQRPDEECTEVGARLTRDAAKRFWLGAFDVYYEGVAVGTCEIALERCFVVITPPGVAPPGVTPTSPPAASPTPVAPAMVCPGAPPSRLTVGGGARMAGGNRDVFASPAGARVMTLLETAPFLVEGGPQCVNGQVWWQIRTTNGLAGWISEGAGGAYYTEACPLVAVPDHGIQCPDAQPSRLRVGQNRLRVVTRGLRLRAQPGLSGPVFDNMDFYEILVVTGGPVCADGAIWWEVQSANSRRAGWAAEATNQQWHTVPDPWLGCEEP